MVNNALKGQRVFMITWKKPSPKVIEAKKDELN